LETEADDEGFRAMVQAGYDPGEAVKLFQLLQQELDEQKTKEPFFFGTHPRLQERIDNYRSLLSKQHLSQTKELKLINSEEFLGQIEELLLDNSLLDLRIGHLKTAQAGVDKLLQRQPNCARAYYLLGEIHRRSGRDESHVQRAIGAYKEAIRFDPNYGDPHRELGLLYRAKNWPKEARVELERYLALCPKATDSNIIRGYLSGMEKL
jgi:predicted Zn-dependent protease